MVRSGSGIKHLGSATLYKMLDSEAVPMFKIVTAPKSGGRRKYPVPVLARENPGLRQVKSGVRPDNYPAGRIVSNIRTVFLHCEEL
jgi:hypothetical protein